MGSIAVAPDIFGDDEFDADGPEEGTSSVAGWQADEPHDEHGDWDESEEVWCDDHAHAGMAGAAAGSREQLAARILGSPAITLATVHVSGVVDQANARQNIINTSEGRKAKRSNYGNAPGGKVSLDKRMLSGLLDLAEDYTFYVTELVGGSHSRNSRHYAGITIDVGIINGRRINSRHPDVRDFMNRCRALGATEVLGPGNRGHSTHIHAAWPRR